MRIDLCDYSFFNNHNDLLKKIKPLLYQGKGHKKNCRLYWT